MGVVGIAFNVIRRFSPFFLKNETAVFALITPPNHFEILPNFLI
jgi:hypothetical protein